MNDGGERLFGDFFRGKHLAVSSKWTTFAAAI